MTNAAIVAIVFGAVAVVALAVLAWTQVADPIKHRGEADEAPLGDDACALTRPLPLEHVPDHPDPDLCDFERDMAATVAARLAIHLTYRSTR